MYSATPIGTNTIFLQIDKRHTPLSALRLFFPTLQIIGIKWRQKVFYEIQDGGPLKFKKNVQRHNTRAIPIV